MVIGKVPGRAGVPLRTPVAAASDSPEGSAARCHRPAIAPGPAGRLEGAAYAAPVRPAGNVVVLMTTGDGAPVPP